ncbi:eukaryotic translation initiation factor 4 gamma 3-like isoform X2 [Argiope bruennichi]|uniref:eukaryotic translation initiation factor 4 gamma 3-like isoform X2 n=1 Tax=Argiope bruennichi TaxID=94029 RepID=UPI0024948E3F|nr:eukaryotic translation initiation factor 4 gamma 3-like isoform X2 [Argiope bruennichi]
MNSGHAEFSQGYHQGSYAYTTPALSSVASNSGHDINKPVAAAQQAMYSSAGMPVPSQHHQSMGGPIASPQPIIQQGQQMSRNPTIAMPTAYYQRNNVPPRTMQSMPRNPIGAVVNQPGQQPSSQYAPMPIMVPIQHNFNSFPPTLVNHQFPQMYQHRAYNAPQYPVKPSQQYLWNYNTPPPQNSNGYFPSHGMSSYQSMPRKSIPAQPQQQRSRNSEKAIPLIDPKTGKNENSDSNICVQFATQVAAVLNDSRSDITSKQPESVRIDTLCSHENEGIRMPITPVVELVDENISELQNIENLSEVEFTENTNLICNDEIGGPYYRKDIDSNSIIESESGATKNVDLEAKTEDREQNVFVVPVESSISDKEESTKTEKLNSPSNVEKVVVFSEIKKTNNVKSVIESDCSNSIQESVQPIVASVKEELVQPNNSEILESSSAVSTKIPDKVLTEGKKNKTKKKKDCNKRGERKKGEEMDAHLDSKEGATVFLFSPPPSVTLVASTFVSTPVSERNSSLVPIMNRRILNAFRLPEDTTPQNGILPSESASKTSFESSNAGSKDKEPHTIVKKQQNNIVLKFSYKEDQWSPLNPEGKKQYDREFLLQLQSQPMSLCKPSNLPNLDVIKNKAHIQKLTEVNRVPPTVMNNPMRAYDPFMSGFARGGLMPRMPRNPGKQQKKGKGKAKKDTSVPNQKVELHESQNPWKPLHKTEVPLNEKDKLKRSVISVLNKLTPQKFETLLAQLKGLNIYTEDRLAFVSNLIFENAINERKFSAVYAKLCKHLALIKVSVSGMSDDNINFSKLLLDKCLEVFELSRSDELKDEENMKTLESADSHKRKELQLEYEEKKRKIKNKRLGNIRFIGELFKLNMFTEPITHVIIKRLLNQENEQSLECLSEFLKTIGKELDDKEATKNSCDKQLDIYLAQIELIVEKRLTSLRIRFMLQDVIDLKKNNWVPRRKENNPKTIDEIRKEAECEVCEQQHLYNNKTNYPKTTSEDRDRQKNIELGVHISENNEDESEKSNSFRDSFRHNIDFEEAIKTVIELSSPNTAHRYINATINDFLERSSEARYSLGQLLSSFLKKKIISFDQYKKGFAGVLEIIDDYALDIPLIWDYIGEILEPMVEDVESPFKLLKEVLEPCIPSEKAGMLVSSILHCAAKRKGTIKLGEVWKKSGVQWSDIIGTDRNVADFVKEHKLEFTASPTMDSPQTRIPMEEMKEMKKHLLCLLEKNSELEEVFDWVTVNISNTSNPIFIRALVTAVHESCLSSSGTTWELNTSKLTSRMPLISLYVSTNEKLQLQALYAIQALMNQLGQPSCLLHQIFDILCADDVISEESFREWEQSDDPNEADGKIVAVHSVKTFFTWL